MIDSPDSPRPPLRPPPAAIRLRLPYAKPLWTYVFLVINGLVFLSTWVLGPDLILSLGAKDNYAIVAGEVWRLITAVFLHVDLLHIAFNSYALLIFGPQVERPYGRVRFLLVYLVSGLAGSAFSFLLSPRPSVGASGAIFGLIGVVGAYLYKYRDRLAAGQARLTNILSVIAYNLLYGFIMTRVDNWAHIGGLVAGLALGWLMAPDYQVAPPEILQQQPQVMDESSPAQWLRGAVLVGIGVALVVVAGFVRWGEPAL